MGGNEVLKLSSDMVTLDGWKKLLETAEAIVSSSQRDLLVWYAVKAQCEANIEKLTPKDEHEDAEEEFRRIISDPEADNKRASDT